MASLSQDSNDKQVNKRIRLVDLINLQSSKLKSEKGTNESEILREPLQSQG